MHKLRKLIKNNIFSLVIIFAVIVSMTVVCASISQQMYITGDAYVRASKDIRVTSIEKLSSTNGAVDQSNPIFSAYTVSVYPSLPNLDSTITYRVTIDNRSNNVYIIDSITNNYNNVNIVDDEASYVGTIIDANTTATLDITLEYDAESLPQLTTQSGTITFHFVVPAAENISYSSEYTSQDNVQDALDELFELFE